MLQLHAVDQGVARITTMHIAGIAAPRAEMIGKKTHWLSGLRDAITERKPFKDHGKALADRRLKAADKEMAKLRKQGMLRE